LFKFRGNLNYLIAYDKRYDHKPGSTRPITGYKFATDNRIVAGSKGLSSEIVYIVFVSVIFRYCEHAFTDVYTE